MSELLATRSPNPQPEKRRVNGPAAVFPDLDTPLALAIQHNQPRAVFRLLLDGTKDHELRLLGALHYFKASGRPEPAGLTTSQLIACLSVTRGIEAALARLEKRGLVQSRVENGREPWWTLTPASEAAGKMNVFHDCLCSLSPAGLVTRDERLDAEHDKVPHSRKQQGLTELVESAMLPRHEAARLLAALNGASLAADEQDAELIIRILKQEASDEGVIPRDTANAAIGRIRQARDFRLALLTLHAYDVSSDG